MKPRDSKILTIVLSLSLFIISLTQNAVITSHEKLDGIEIQASSSLSFFMAGGIAFIGGGIFEELIWLANPLSLLSIILLLKNNKKSKTTCLIALTIAISFAFWDEILANEGGGMAKIRSLESGYYLWVLSILVLNIGIHSYFNKLKETENTAGQK